MCVCVRACARACVCTEPILDLNANGIERCFSSGSTHAHTSSQHWDSFLYRLQGHCTEINVRWDSSWKAVLSLQLCPGGLLLPLVRYVARTSVCLTYIVRLSVLHIFYIGLPKPFVYAHMYVCLALTQLLPFVRWQKEIQ